ncbi:MAG: DUF6713 family protein [Anaerolineales bacterium]
MLDILFLLNVAWIMAHELDAIRHHEWRVLPITAPFAEPVGYRVFVLAHIPLLMGIMAAGQDTTFQVAFNLFLIIHVGLHWLFRNHPQYEFSDRFSRLLIVGGGPLGALHLALLAL